MTIRFYRVGDRYGAFSNFAPYSIEIEGTIWPTSEHYFQAQKFLDGEVRERVRTAKSPMVAAGIGRGKRDRRRADWDRMRDEVMLRAVRAKFSQHPELRELLLSTGDEEIVEHTPNDDYWGDGGDGSGANMLGKIVMMVRSELRESRPDG